jgi:non-homologous end joining protein Ku
MAYFEDIPDVRVPADMLTLAEHILNARKAANPEEFEDHYETARGNRRIDWLRSQGLAK